MYSYNSETKETIKVYNGVRDVKLDGFSPSEVIKCAKGKTKRHRGLGWAYVGDEPRDIVLETGGKAKAVVSYDPNTKQDVKVYSSIAEVAEDDFNPACVSKCCLGKMKIHKDLAWRFIDDEPRDNFYLDFSKKIARCDINTGAVLQVYSSITAATKDSRYKFNRPSISSCANGKRNSHAGFAWRFV